MKKKLIVAIIITVAVALVALGLVWYFVWNDGDYIGRDAAADAALADAGLARGAVQRLESKFERDDGLVYYEVSFVAGVYEYEYVIDPNTGAVLHMEFENVFD